MKNGILSFIAFTVFLSAFVVSGFFSVEAQDNTPIPTPAASDSTNVEVDFSQPVNLSLSGAASQPRIVSSPDGIKQAFWIDSFDGLMSSIYIDGQWSPPIYSAIQPFIRFTDARPMSEIPTFLEDSFGRVHAFFYGEQDKFTGIRPLLYSQTLIGSVQWSVPQILAESAVGFDISASPEGDINIAYLRTLNTEDAPAGLYFKRFPADGTGWGAPALIYPSVYYRLFTKENTWVRISDGGNGTVHVVWHDPYQEKAYYSNTLDLGVTWGEPEALGDFSEEASHPRVFSTATTNLRNWESSPEFCRLMQQINTINSLDSSTDQIFSWSETDQVFPNLEICPGGDRFYITPGDGSIIWVWGQGSQIISVSQWTTNKMNWTENKDFSIIFNESENEPAIILDDLSLTLDGERFTIVGVDPIKNEIWSTEMLVNLDEVTLAPPSPWASLQPMKNDDPTVPVPNEISSPRIEMDTEGYAHIIWSQTEPSPSIGISINYARWDGSTMSPPVELFNHTQYGRYSQYDLFTDLEDNLHTAWVSGSDGGIIYSKAASESAGSSSGWLPGQNISEPGPASSPQLGMGVNGEIYIAYAVPINEDRGVYLSVSTDKGNTWSLPAQILDGVSAGWEVIDRPNFLISRDGTIHVVGVYGPHTESGFPAGIFYIQSDDGGQTWTDPITLVEAGFDFPNLVMKDDQLHIFYINVSDNSVYHRYIELFTGTTGDSAWNSPIQIPGWNNISAPFGVFGTKIPSLYSSSNSNIHLLGLDLVSGDLIYNTWNGSNWGQNKTYDVSYTLEGFQFQPGMVESSSVDIASALQGGSLGIVWRALGFDSENNNSDLVPRLFFIEREIDPVEINYLPQSTSEQTILIETSEVTPEPTTTISATTQIEPPIQANSSQARTVSPLVLGGGLAVIIIVLLFVWRWFWNRRN